MKSLVFVDLHVDKCSYAQLKGLIRSVLDFTRVDRVFLAIPSPLKETARYHLSSRDKIDFRELPEELGDREIERGNGVAVSSEQDENWNVYLTKQSSLGKAGYSIRVTFRSGLLDDKQIKELFLILIKAIKPWLALSYDSKDGPFDVAYYKTSRGLWAGLRDVYQHNYLGKAYSDLVGRDRLLSIQLFESATEVDAGIYFEISGEFLKQRDKIIEAIGKEYFVKDRKIQAGKVEEKSGVIALVKTLYSLSKQEPEVTADIHPFSNK